MAAKAARYSSRYPGSTVYDIIMEKLKEWHVELSEDEL